MSRMNGKYAASLPVTMSVFGRGPRILSPGKLSILDNRQHLAPVAGLDKQIRNSKGFN
jgi:hypothetical protein